VTARFARQRVYSELSHEDTKATKQRQVSGFARRDACSHGVCSQITEPSRRQDRQAGEEGFPRFAPLHVCSELSHEDTKATKQREGAGFARRDVCSHDVCSQITEPSRRQDRQAEEEGFPGFARRCVRHRPTPTTGLGSGTRPGARSAKLPSALWPSCLRGSAPSTRPAARSADPFSVWRLGVLAASFLAHAHAAPSQTGSR
jgi:hypothetical protein